MIASLRLSAVYENLVFILTIGAFHYESLCDAGFARVENSKLKYV
jgi:hypothetical protein